MRSNAPTGWRGSVLATAGFSLIELVVAMVIIGVLAALAIPKLGGAALKAKITEGCSVLAAYDKAQTAYVTEAGSLGELGVLFVDDPSEEGYSEYFFYEQTFDGDISSTLSATARMGMGEVVGNTVNSTVTASAVVLHSMDSGFERYLPNW